MKKVLSRPAAPLKMTEFSKAVMTWVKKIPRGKVATYGQIARLAGKPHGARGVGWILNSSAESHNLPWQRVLNSRGKISFPVKSDEYKLQRSLLQKEGIKFDEDGAIDLALFGWNKDPKSKRNKNIPSMFGR
jgi:methylated-DNA-protein-cysteine methyltransferase related protein